MRATEGAAAVAERLLLLVGHLREGAPVALHRDHDRVVPEPTGAPGSRASCPFTVPITTTSWVLGHTAADGADVPATPLRLKAVTDPHAAPTATVRITAEQTAASSGSPSWAPPTICSQTVS